MKVLVEIVHPADVLFFKRPIEAMRQRGDQVGILSRHKDVACDLLDEFGFEHTPVSKAGNGILGLASELAIRNWRTFKAVRAFQPDVMVGFGAVSISQVGKLTGVPTISFYDSENASLQNKLSYPFLTQLYVPTAYFGRVPKGRTTYVRGTKELSYLHPQNFEPEVERAISAGLDQTRKNFFIRVVDWRANHDLGKAGWSLDLLQGVLGRLSCLGKVHLSTEKSLPVSFEAYLTSCPRKDIHHLIAFCDGFLGESATMASEAAILGVPAVYSGKDFPGYTQELEGAHLMWNLKEASELGVQKSIEWLLDDKRHATKNLRDQYVASCPDWALTVLNAVDTYGR